MPTIFIFQSVDDFSFSRDLNEKLSNKIKLMKEKISEANERWDAVRTALLRCQTASEVRNYFKLKKKLELFCAV